MDRRLFLLGVLLIVIGILIAFSYTYQALNASTVATGSRQTITIAPNRIVSSPISLNSTSMVYLVYNSNAVPITFYLLNSTAFDSLSPYLQSGNLSSNVLTSLESGDLYKKAYNNTGGVFLLQGSSSAQGLSPASYNLSLVLAGGTYYAIYRNPGNSSATTTYGYVLPNSGLITGTNQIISSGLGLYGEASAILILAGLILCVYSFVLPGRKPKNASRREEAIQKLYLNIEKKEKTAAERKPGKRKRR
jgi:hypothetical protein